MIVNLKYHKGTPGNVKTLLLDSSELVPFPNVIYVDGVQYYVVAIERRFGTAGDAVARPSGEATLVLELAS